jgi:hypothetical protein
VSDPWRFPFSAADEATTAPSRWWHALPAALVAILGLIFYWHDFRFFWVGDYQLWFGPMFEEVTRAWRAGEWPILSQGTWASGNLAGEFQCGTFSIVFNAILCAIWNLPLTIHGKAAALSIVHLMLLATGVSLLARKRGLGPAYATLAALVASLNGWLIIWAATDWFGALAGFTWVPWLWWSLLLAKDEAARLRRWFVPAIFVYLLISAGNPYALIMGALVAGREFIPLLLQRRWHVASAFILAGFLGIGLSAPAWLALVELMHGSSRESWGAITHDSWKVPWLAWTALFLPALESKWCTFFLTWQRHVTVEMIAGMIPTAACLAAIIHSRGHFVFRHLGDILFLAVIVALASAPGFGSFRWSFRLLPIFFLVLGLLGAAAVRELPNRISALVALGGSLIMWTAATLNGTCTDHWFALAQSVILLAWFLASRHLETPIVQWLPSAATIAMVFAGYMLLPTHQKVSRHEFRENLRNPAPLDPERLYLSVHNFRDIINDTAAKPGFGTVLRPCNTPQLAGLHFINGYSSFTAQGLPLLFETHGSLEPEKAALILSPESERLLDLLGVDGLCIATEFVPLAEQLKTGWQLTHIAEEGQVYHHWPRRATACKSLESVFDRQGDVFATPPVKILTAGRNHVTVEIPPSDPAHPIALAFPRPWFRGYQATLNRRPVPVRAYLDFIPLVELPPGSYGIVELRYWPNFLRLGLPIAAVSAAILLAAAFISRRIVPLRNS